MMLSVTVDCDQIMLVNRLYSLSVGQYASQYSVIYLLFHAINDR